VSFPGSSRTLLACALTALLAACDSTPPTTPTPEPPAGCSFAVSDAPPTPMDAGGGEFTVAVTAAAGCLWAAASSASFIAPMGAASGSGAGLVRFGIHANDGAPRQGSVQVASKTLIVQQAGAGASGPCELGVTPTAATVAAGGADVTIDVSVVSGTSCTWSAASNDPFIAVKSAGPGAGPGSAVLTVSANGGATRVGTVTIGTRTVTILQESTAAPSCTFSVSPTETAAASAGGTVVVTVAKTQGTACPWIAEARSGFLSIAGNSSGVDSGSITVAVEANGGVARSGTVIVAGQPVTVSQAAPPLSCEFSISPSQTPAFSSGGQTFVHVQNTQGDVCPWTAVANDSFLVITSGSSGVNTGIVAIQIQANTGALRAGTVTIAGQTFTVTQNGPTTPCLYQISPTTIEAGAAQMSEMVYITKLQGDTCNWSAQSSSSFVTLDPASGQIPLLGYSNMMVFVWENTGPARSATVTVGNATLTVTQAAALSSTSAALLSFDSDPGDFVGGGQSQNFTFTSSQFEVTLNGSQSVLTFNRPLLVSPPVSLRLEAPAGLQLTPGYYPNSHRFASGGLPGLNFGYDHRGCNDSTGRFLIAEAVYGPGGTVQRFHARFEQYCSGQSAGLRGTIWIDAAGSMTPPTLPPFP
jgi:hypothetical protein